MLCALIGAPRGEEFDERPRLLRDSCDLRIEAESRQVDRKGLAAARSEGQICHQQ